MGIDLTCQQCKKRFSVAALRLAQPLCTTCRRTRTRKSPRIIDRFGGSALEQTFAQAIVQCPEASVLAGFKRNYRFHESRRWEWDFAWVERRLAVELQGGQWQRGRHTRGGKAYQNELEKHRAAVMSDWWCLCYTTDDIMKNDGALLAVREVMRAYELRGHEAVMKGES